MPTADHGGHDSLTIKTESIVVTNKFIGGKWKDRAFIGRNWKDERVAMLFSDTASSRIGPSILTKKTRQQSRSWDELYETLVQHGDCEVPARYPDSGLSW
jgi:hypothetical protein